MKVMGFVGIFNKIKNYFFIIILDNKIITCTIKLYNFELKIEHLKVIKIEYFKILN